MYRDMRLSTISDYDEIDNLLYTVIVICRRHSSRNKLIV